MNNDTIDQVWFIAKKDGNIDWHQSDYWPESRRDEGDYCVEHYKDWTWDVVKFTSRIARDEYLRERGYFGSW